MNTIRLKTASTQEWRQCVLKNFDCFMADHTDCERKAVATAMALISKFPEKPELVEPMISLAREELSHFRTMYRILQKRKINLHTNQQDPYIQRLTKMIRHPPDHYFLDRLLIAGIIEERACERLGFVAPEIKEAPLAKIYQALAEEEKAHGSIFLRLANHFYAEKEVEERLERLTDYEAKIMEEIPIRPAIH